MCLVFALLNPEKRVLAGSCPEIWASNKLRMMPGGNFKVIAGIHGPLVHTRKLTCIPFQTSECEWLIVERSGLYYNQTEKLLRGSLRASFSKSRKWSTVRQTFQKNFGSFLVSLTLFDRVRVKSDYNQLSHKSQVNIWLSKLHIGHRKPVAKKQIL